MKTMATYHRDIQARKIANRAFVVLIAIAALSEPTIYWVLG